MIQYKKYLLVCASLLLVACGMKEDDYLAEIHGKWYGAACESSKEEVEDFGSINVKSKSIKLEYDGFTCIGDIEFDYEEDGKVYYSIYDDDEYIGDLTYDSDYEYLKYDSDDVAIYFLRNVDDVELLEDSEILEKTSNNTDVDEDEETENKDEEESDDTTERDNITERDNTVVRNVCWGDSKETVKQIESLELLDEDDISLLYETSLNGAECYLIYCFEDDKLFRVGYTVKDKYSSGQYISFLYSFEDSLEEKYGSPEPESGIIKFDTDSMIETAGEASALEYGLTAYKYEWYTDDTRIMLGATSADYEVSLILGYEDINYEGPDDEF